MKSLKKRESGHFITNFIKEKLLDSFNEERVRGAQLFFKEGFRGYGITKKQVITFVTEALREYPEIVNVNTCLTIAEQLFKSRMYEECQAAIILLEKYIKYMNKKTFNMFSRWIDSYVENWGVCDSFCIKVLSPFIINHPDLLSPAGKWISSENRWKRRAICVVLLKLCREGQFFINEGFTTASILISDKDEMVQKGVGWLLKEISRTDLNSVIQFLNYHKNKVTRLVLRYALERVEPERKKNILKKFAVNK